MVSNGNGVTDLGNGAKTTYSCCTKLPSVQGIVVEAIFPIVRGGGKQKFSGMTLGCTDSPPTVACAASHCQFQDDVDRWVLSDGAAETNPPVIAAILIPNRILRVVNQPYPKTRHHSC